MVDWWLGVNLTGGSSALGDENLRSCLSGKFPLLCDHSRLTPEQLKRVTEAERLENLATCLTGKFPLICNRALLRPAEVERVKEAERLENLKVCLSGQFPL